MPNFKVTFGLSFDDELSGESKESGTYTLVLAAPCQILANKCAQAMVGQLVYERESLASIISLDLTSEPITPAWP